MEKTDYRFDADVASRFEAVYGFQPLSRDMTIADAERSYERERQNEEERFMTEHQGDNQESSV